MVSDLRTITPIPKDAKALKSAKIVFFCKNCEEFIPAKQSKRSFTFCCEKCGKAQVAFGTEESLRNYYRVR